KALLSNSKSCPQDVQRFIDARKEAQERIRSTCHQNAMNNSPTLSTLEQNVSNGLFYLTKVITNNPSTGIETRTATQQQQKCTAEPPERKHPKKGKVSGEKQQCQ
ncbi:Hypothetical predicted protein, partial [Pelobates cultripes]